MKKMIFVLITIVLAISGNALALDMNQVKIHGFISQGYLKSSDNDFWNTKTQDGTFQFNEMGVNFIAEPTDNLRLGVQFLSRDLGEDGNNEVEVDWAFGDYRYRNWLGIRAGLMKRCFGLYNQSRDIDAARTGIFLPTSVYPDVYRNWILRTQGIGIYGTLPGDLSYEVQYGNLPMDSDDPVVKSFNKGYRVIINNVDTANVIAGTLRWDTPLSGFALGVSGFSIGDIKMLSDTDIINITRYDSYVASLEYRIENMTFSAEYRQTVASTKLNNKTVRDNSVSEFYYAMTAYRFTDWFELGLGYSVTNSDKDDRDGKRFEEKGRPAALAWLKDLSLTTRFDINDYWIFKLEGHYMNGLVGTTIDPADNPSEDWFLFAAKVTFSF